MFVRLEALGRVDNLGPSGLTTEVESVEMRQDALQEALPGGNLCFYGNNVAVKDLKNMGLLHRGQIGNGYATVLDCHKPPTAVKFTKLLTRIDRRSVEDPENEPKLLMNGDAGCQPTKSMVVETFSEYPPLAHFAVRDIRQTLAAGLIKNVQKKDPCGGKITTRILVAASKK